MSTALEQASKLIPAEVRMISGCKDEQTSADVSNVARYVLHTYCLQASNKIPSTDHLDTFARLTIAYLTKPTLLEYFLIFLLSMQLSAPRPCGTCRWCMVSLFLLI
jgi:hypothetical protein